MVSEPRMKSTVLLVDDDPVDVRALQSLIEAWGYEVLTSRSGKEALALLDEQQVDLLISDVRMPGMSGEAVVEAVQQRTPQLPVILITGYGDIRSAVAAMKLGAFDYIVKPPDEDEFKLIIERALEHSQLVRENRFLRAEMASSGMSGEKLLARSEGMLAVMDLVNRVARTDSTVLITGETGTGKEVVAQAIHFKSARAEQPLVSMNCAAVNENLIESELFGHEKGAFTGAVARRRGRFEDADNGTLLLDEISETSTEFQARLLRVLQESCFERVGGSETVSVDVRLIATTNRNLEEAVAEGRFREDLFYRLRVIPIEIPPLRERREDIPLLAAHFATVFGERYHQRPLEIVPKAIEKLQSRTWPGNVRELLHVVERAVVLASDGTLDAKDFPEADTSATTGGDETLQDHVDQASREHVIRVLDQTNWKKKEAAEILGVDRATLYRMLKKYSIEKGR